MSEIKQIQKLAANLADDGFKVVLFDFSGHGDSEGSSREVCVSKSVDELARVIDAEVTDKSKINFLAFSYGAAVLDEYLAQNSEIQPGKILLFSPCIFPLESCFLNGDSVFGKDILNTSYNHEFCVENGIRELHYPASHSLFEAFDEVEKESREFFKN